MNRPYGMKDDVFTITRENLERAREYGKNVGLSGALARTLDILLGQDVESEKTPEYYHVGQVFQLSCYKWKLIAVSINEIGLLRGEGVSVFLKSSITTVDNIEKITPEELAQIMRETDGNFKLEEK